jgi:peptidyl-prolyl cis-trans isomerase SurA
MQPGEISHPHTFNTEEWKNAARIVYYKRFTPPHVANMKDDYQKLFNETLEMRRQEAVERWFEKAKTEVFINVSKEYNTCELLAGPNRP